MITNLTGSSVSILTSIGGQNHRAAYVNSAAGRMQLVAQQDADTVVEIMEVWGDTPTVEEPPESEPLPMPTTEDRLSALEAVQLDLILGGAR